MANLSSYLPGGIDPSAVTITGGTINGTTIGASTAAAGTFTTFTSNGIDDNADATAITIDSSEKVGIGTTSPSSYLPEGSHLVLAGSGHVGMTIASGTSSEGGIFFADGTSSDARYRGIIRYNQGSDYMQFYTTAAERMRINSSGGVFIGGSFSDVVSATSGTGFSYASGYLALSRDTSSAASAIQYLNRTDADGQFLQFRKDGSTIGMISTRSAQLSIGKAGTGLEFNDANDSIIPFSPNANNTRDNALDLGMSGVRFDDIYATNDVINTSDRNEKQDIEELTETEQRVAVAAKALLRKFRWKTAARTKGHDARIHFGIIAQDLQAAFEAEGLDAGEYGMFICSNWWETYTDVLAVQAVEAQDAVYDEEGNLVSEAVEAVEAVEAHTRTDTYNTEAEAPEDAVRKERMGVRYSELLAFIIAAI